MRHTQDPLRAPLARQIRHPLSVQQEGRRRVNDLLRRQCQTAAEAERPQAAILLLLFAKEAERVRNTKLRPAATSAAAAKNVHAGKAEDEAPLGTKATATAAAAATTTTSDATAAAGISWDQVPVQGEGMFVSKNI